MHTQRQLLDLARERAGLKDYSHLADRLGVSRQHLSECKYGKPISNETAIKLAELCELDPVYVVACIEHHRAERLEDTVTLPIWRVIAERFADVPSTAARALLVAMAAGFLMSSFPHKSEASGVFFAGQSIPYAKYAAFKCLIWLITGSHFFIVIVKGWRSNPALLAKVAALSVTGLALSGCATLTSAPELAWQASNVVDAVQTDRMIAHGACIEGDPITRAEIGAKPDDARIAEWAIGGAAVHAGVSWALSRLNLPTAEKVWQYVSLGDKAATIAHNVMQHGC